MPILLMPQWNGFSTIRTVLHKGVRTGDIWQEGCQRVGTREMGDAVLRAL